MRLAALGLRISRAPRDRAEADAIVKAHMKKNSPTEAALYWRFKPAVLPVCRFHRITYQHFVEVIAPRTFKGPHIGVGGTKFDASQLHVALALRATWPFDGQRRFGTSMRFRHVMHP